MADKKTCNERMPPWFKHRCSRPAKFLCSYEDRGLDGELRTVKGYRCGIHAKRYEKLEKI